MKEYSLRRLRVAGWSANAAPRMPGASGWLSKNEISTGVVLSKVSLSDGARFRERFREWFMVAISLVLSDGLEGIKFSGGSW